MSLEALEPSTGADVGVTEDGLDYDEIKAHLGDTVIGRETHINSEAFVVRPDRVVDALSSLKEEAGFDHCSCVTAQQYEDRYESIYHLKKYDNPAQEVGVVVPTSIGNPTSQSGESVFRTADWHEREAYDLVGVQYDEHPDLRRILLPETWQGHPLGLNYDQEQHQIVTLRGHANPLQEDHHADETDTMFLNIGILLR